MALQEILSHLVNENTTSSPFGKSSTFSNVPLSQATLSHTNSNPTRSLAGSRTVYFAEPVITKEALLLLNGRRKPLIDYLTHLMVKERYRSNIVPNKLEVTVHVDRDTGKQLLHIKQTVAADANRALDYWNRLSEPIDTWISSLPRDQREFVLNDVYMTIHWTN